MSDGLFLETARAVADDYPFLEFEEIHVDALCMQLALDPTRYDVLVMENLFGDVLSDLCAGLVGGLGLVPGANIGARHAVFEAVHGSAPDIAGKGLANPIALIRSAALPALEQGRAALPAEMCRTVRETGLARKTKLLMPPGVPARQGGRLARVRNFNLHFRHDLGLFAAVRPLKNLPGLPARFHNVD